MSVGKYLNKNKIGALILIVVIIIAFGFGGFGGGFLSNNQNNIAKIDKTNITNKDFINYINQIFYLSWETLLLKIKMHINILVKVLIFSQVKKSLVKY